jgi:hypothetical protein
MKPFANHCLDRMTYGADRMTCIHLSCSAKMTTTAWVPTWTSNWPDQVLMTRLLMP